ncbi:MAG TPA: 4-(cytidine 5'-diphospho)-2-C-methyl-D-erythritol kinase, partial [Candidatus Angelobacter sp.]|nr:4-(cytidine 5'-diphospho)-2-C-methyl-D-erythritol kinase [Candidatus Angelobacter sp.]
HDVVRVEVAGGEGIEICCSDPRVPCDATNTCWKIAERVLKTVGRQSKVVITIEKHLPVQGGMGAASSNAVATLLGLERALNLTVSPLDKLRIAAEVGSDLPLFLIGGTVLGVDHGQEVYALQDLPVIVMVVVTPPVGVSTPQAFAQWDALMEQADTDEAIGVASYEMAQSALTAANVTGTIKEFDQVVFAWWSESLLSRARPAEGPASGVPALGGDRAETPLLDLVRTGIENDFERVVFPEYPELREVKSVLQREGARYASLSGSGSTLYGLFGSDREAGAAAERLRAAGHAAVATKTLTREEFWKQLVVG